MTRFTVVSTEGEPVSGRVLERASVALDKAPSEPKPSDDPLSLARLHEELAVSDLLTLLDQVQDAANKVRRTQLISPRYRQEADRLAAVVPVVSNSIVSIGGKR